MDGLPKTLNHIAQELLGEDGPYFCGDELTYADFQIFHYLDNVCTLIGGIEVLEKLAGREGEKLKAFINRMKGIPAIQQRLAERPQSGTGQVGVSGSIMHSVKVPCELPAVKESLAKALK